VGSPKPGRRCSRAARRGAVVLATMRLEREAAVGEQGESWRLYRGCRGVRTGCRGMGIGCGGYVRRERFVTRAPDVRAPSSKRTTNARGGLYSACTRAGAWCGACVYACAGVGGQRKRTSAILGSDTYPYVALRSSVFAVFAV
jgi:hypothetical protein